MHKTWIILSFILFTAGQLFAQDKKPEDFGYRHLQMHYKNDPVDILVLSKKGEEHKVKPILLFDQGSQARPLILLDNEAMPFGLFPFKTDSLLTDYHLAIISKPYIPLISFQKDLKHGAFVQAQTGMAPGQFYARDHVDYYVKRAKKLLRF